MLDTLLEGVSMKVGIVTFAVADSYKPVKEYFDPDVVSWRKVSVTTPALH